MITTAPAEIERMFSAIAPRYDTLNRVLSLGTDRLWRRRTCLALGVRPGEEAADLCCGTGDLSLALQSRGARVVGADFSAPMLDRAAGKGVHHLAQADCLRLPFPDGAFDLVTVAFGVRNLADLPAGLAEMRRVLKPGGRVGILEFARPTGRFFPHLYAFWLRRIVPALGAAISGRGSAYRYLSTSIEAFHPQAVMEEKLRGAGFEQVSHLDLTFGVAALYQGVNPPSAAPSAPSACGAGSPPAGR